MRRSLALAAVTTLASSVVLTGAHGALAVALEKPGAPSPSTVSSSASATAAATVVSGKPDIDGPPREADDQDKRSVELTVDGVPHKITAGAAATEFTVKFSNESGSSMVFLPALDIRNEAKDLDNRKITLDYKRLADKERAGDKDWLPAFVSKEESDGLRLLGPTDEDGAPSRAGLVYVAAHKSVSFKVRMVLPKDAPTGPAGLAFVAIWGSSDERELKSRVKISESEPSFFCILPPVKPKPSPSPSATKTGKPSPSASASGKPSPSASVSTSPTPTPKPTPTETKSDAASPTPTETKSDAPSPTETKSESPSPTETKADSPAPTASTGTPSPTASSTDVVVPFPMPTPKPPVVPITSTDVQAAKAKADSDEKSLAFTGGGSDATPIAIGGATALALGVGTLVLLRRRKSGSHA